MTAGGLGGFLAAVLRERGERNREAAEAVPAAPRPILLPEADDPFDPSEGDAVIEHFADLAFISYRNANGEHSYRRITIRGIQPKVRRRLAHQRLVPRARRHAHVPRVERA